MSKQHRSRPRQSSFAASNPLRRRPPPLTMKSLPPLPAGNGVTPTPPSLSQPDLTWGVSATSFPSSPSLNREQTGRRSPPPLTAATSDGFVNTGSILRAFDELDTSPVITEHSPTYTRNHPYIPWSSAVRARVISPGSTSPQSAVSQYSRPLSRSGARAPEPAESALIQPTCWGGVRSGTSRWARFTRAVRKNVENAQRVILRKKRPAVAPVMMPMTPVLQVVSPPSSQSSPSLVSSIPRGIITPQHLLDRVRPLTPVAPTPHILPGGASPVVARTPSDVTTPIYHLYSAGQSPSTRSFASAGTTALEDWLADRRRLSLEHRLSGIEGITLDEYERRGSWLHREPVAPPGEDEDEEDGAVQSETTRRRDAVRQGWLCGFVGCLMHSPPGSQRVGRYMSPIHWTSTWPLSSNRLGLDISHSSPVLRSFQS
jgi:hypothetical protein